LNFQESKKLISFITFLLCHVFLFSQDCPSGNVTFETQEEVDIFLQTYPDCKEIKGDLVIKSGVYNLNGLLGITSIEGALVVKFNSTLINFSGLDSLVSIGFSTFEQSLDFGDFTYYDEPSIFLYLNSSLENLDGLSNLKEIKSLFVVYNQNLKNLDGLDNLESINGMLYVNFNQSLKDIDALSKVSILGTGSYGEYFEGFVDTKTTNASLYITGNDQLESLDPLQSITNLEGSVMIKGNDILTGDILPNLQSIGTDYEQTSGIGIDEYEYRTLELTNNANLSYCANAALCNIISNEEYVEVENNGTACSINEILLDCENAGKIVHQVFYDNNENGIRDSGDHLLNIGNILIQPGNITSITNQENGGIVYLDFGIYEFTIDSSLLMR